MMRTAAGRAGNTIRIAGALAMLTAVAASGCTGPEAGEPRTGPTAQSGDSLRAKPAEKVSVCHRAGLQWVPLTLPEPAAMKHVGSHGDYLYDTSAGQCCTNADCAAGKSCSHIVGSDDESVMGVCVTTGGGGMTTDPRGLLLAVALFAANSGAAIPLPGILTRDATDHYSLSFTVNGVNAQVSLATFVTTSGTPLGASSSTPVTVTFPSRNDGLITLDQSPAGVPTDYLHLSVTASSFSGVGTVDMDNANADIDFNQLQGTVSLFSGDAYFVTIGGSFTVPATPPVGGAPLAGLYLRLPDGAILVDVLVYGGDAYQVRL